MTNFQCGLLDAGVGKTKFMLRLAGNKMMIVYIPMMYKRELWFAVYQGVKHHNDKWKLVDCGPFKREKVEIPFKGPKGYNR